MEQNESESSRMLTSDVKTGPPKNARATQDSCVPGHHYHQGVLTCLVSSPMKKKLESKLSNSPWGHMKGPAIFKEYSK